MSVLLYSGVPVFQILVGFGMGGWLMAQAAKERSHRIRAMVGIATWADLPGTVNKWATPKVMNC